MGTKSLRQARVMLQGGNSEETHTEPGGAAEGRPEGAQGFLRRVEQLERGGEGHEAGEVFGELLLVPDVLRQDRWAGHAQRKGRPQRRGVRRWAHHRNLQPEGFHPGRGGRKFLLK